MIDGGVRSASVTALRDSKLSFVSRATFEAVAQDTPELSRHLLIVVTRRLRDTNNALTATNFLSVKGRVASALLQLAEAFGRDVGSGRILIEQKVSQSELAAMAGIARENVTRVLTDWTNRSWLSRLAGYYCLENKKAIRGEAGRSLGHRRSSLVLAPSPYLAPYTSAGDFLRVQSHAVSRSSCASSLARKMKRRAESLSRFAGLHSSSLRRGRADHFYLVGRNRPEGSRTSVYRHAAEFLEFGRIRVMCWRYELPHSTPGECGGAVGCHPHRAGRDLYG